MKMLFKSSFRLFLFPLWAGFLAWPFTGIVNAVQIAAAAGVLLALWKLKHSDAVQGFLRRFRQWLSGHGALHSIRRSLNSRLLLVSFAVILVILPAFLNNYFRDVMTLTCMYAILALGLNIVVGQAGLLNLGYVAFYAVGAYTYAILSTNFGLSFWPGLALGGLSAALYAFIVGLPILRLRGDYFAIVTLGLGEITRIVLNNWDNMTGGPNGIAGIGRPVIAGYTLHTTLDFYYLVLFMVIVTVLAMHRLMDSRIGRAWIAIREDEVAAASMGIDTHRLKLLAFVIASAVAGIAGVFFAAKMAFVSPESFTFFESVMILCMVVLGGMGSIPGIILGAVLLITLPEMFRDFQDYRVIAFGAALVLMMIFRPQGLLGKVRKTA